jgi:glyoxylase-like metal-dependent hydrolase (beta-lactamase superfamily II)
MHVTGLLQTAAWERGELPPVELVRPGLWSIPVPLPNNPLRYVLVYVLELDDGVAIVDAGWDTPDAWAALNAGLAAAGGSVADVRSVVVTHIHPDHYGLAGRVREASGAWIGLHPADAALLEGRYVSTDRTIAYMKDLLEVSGAPADAISDLANASMQIRDFVRMAQPDRLVEDGDDLGLAGWDLKAIWTPGHSPGHLCLYSAEQRLLLSGDHVLPRISPNISYYTPDIPNPLADYLDSLGKVEHLECDEVLPGHEYRFAGLSDRVGQLRDHHHARLEEIRSALEGTDGLSCWDLTLRLTWSRSFDTFSTFMQRAASGETLAHLVLLEGEGTITRTPGRPAIFRLAEHSPTT